MKTSYTPLWVLACICWLLELGAYAAPGRIQDLTATMTGTTVTLRWTTPTPGAGQTLISNDVRMGTSSINTGNWTNNTRIDSLDDSPGTPGTPQTATITGLSTNTSYYFAIKVSDTSGTWSIPSNLLGVKTLVTTNGFRPAWDISPESFVVGYRIYTGYSSYDYNTAINVGNVTSALIPTPILGQTYYVICCAYSGDDQDSTLSNEIVYTQPADP